MKHVLGMLMVLLATSVGHADELGGWRFTPPPRATRADATDLVAFTTITGQTFCRISLFAARAPMADDAAFEWKSIVEHNFTVGAKSKPVSRKTKSGLPYVVTSASLADTAKNTYAGALYVLQPKGATGSVFLTSTNAASLAKCSISPFLESLTLVSAPAPTAAAQPAPTTTPTTATPTPAPTPATSADAAAIVGTWSIGSGNPARNGGTGSISRRQYVFKPDGTYTYFSETFDGYTLWIHVRESGTFSVAGEQLTVTPTASVISSRDWKSVYSTKKQPLEKVTYTAKKVFFSGLQEWNLVLTPPARTERDGTFASNPSYPGSYLLSGSYKPEWKFP